MWLPHLFLRVEGLGHNVQEHSGLCLELVLLRAALDGWLRAIAPPHNWQPAHNTTSRKTAAAGRYWHGYRTVAGLRIRIRGPSIIQNCYELNVLPYLVLFLAQICFHMWKDSEFGEMIRYGIFATGGIRIYSTGFSTFTDRTFCNNRISTIKTLKTVHSTILRSRILHCPRVRICFA